MHRLPHRVFAALLLVACSAEPSRAGGDVAPDALAASLRSANPPIVLDVRTPAEFASGRVPGARNVPIDQLAARLDTIAPSREVEIVVYCERGPRAAKAQSTLTSAGFTNVRHLEGDMSGWRSKGLPCEGCAPE
jgi:rhodanese-related sulfurtransferase